MATSETSVITDKSYWKAKLWIKVERVCIHFTPMWVESCHDKNNKHDILLKFFSQVTTIKKINNKWYEQKKIYNNVTIRELTEKEVAKDCAGFIIKSLLSLSEIISSFFSKKI